MKAIYQFHKEEILRQFATTEQGLSDAAIPALLEKYGPNELAEKKHRTRLSIFIAQFKDIMILILVIAAGISFAVGEHTDAIVILAIIIANAWMGFSQENNAEQSVRMLKKMSAQFALVFRNNNPVRIEASQLVPGDLVILGAGDIVPADGRLIEISSLRTDEASLTGESHAVDKTTEPLSGTNLMAGDQLNMIFKGTIVSNGSAKLIVTGTGMNTEIGKIAGLLDTAIQRTPLQKRLAVFSKQLAVIVLIICAIVFGVGLLRGEPVFQMFLTALSLAVAALPEALPAVITIALARGASRMVKQKALIRKLPAVETLGSVTYICTDKTGTLTENKMTVEKIEFVPGNEELFSHALLLNNEVRYTEDGELLGDSTETALVQYALMKGHSAKEAAEKLPLAGKIPFDSERMRMSTLHRYGDKWILFVKGAPARMIEIMEQKYKHSIPAWLELNRAWAAEGLRVLFFGYKLFGKDPGMPELDMEKDLEFLGMTAMIDPPRAAVIDAIQQCRAAGIRTVMITGDQALTAKAIAERLHIFKEGNTDVKTGADLDQLTEGAFRQKVKNIAVYARVSPEQKLRIVQALQHNGEFVAMTGDGVNDAPSLKQADIGLAMGITGTDVSKEAADMILLDDNFTTIVKAVREGRRIYENIRKFILYVLSCNLSEILTIFLAPILGFAVPLLPIHILWINLVTDGLPGIALVAEPSEKNSMKKPPRPPGENLFAGGLVGKIILSGLIMTIASLTILWWAVSQGYGLRSQQTMVFTTLCFVQLGNALSSRWANESIFNRRIFTNPGMWGAILLTVLLQLAIIYIPFLDGVFKTTVLGWKAMSAVLLVTAGSIVSIEFLKFLTKRKDQMNSSKSKC